MTKKAATDKPSHLYPFKNSFPYLILIILLFLSVLVWQYYKNTTLDREERRFSEYIAYAKTSILEQIERNKMVLKGVVGVFAAADEVSQEKWSSYFEYQQIVTEHPGIRDAIFAKVVRPSELEEHLTTLRAEGHLEYSIWPDGERELYTPCRFVAPFTESYRAGLGFDLYSEPVRRATMDKARDSGTAAISGKMTIVTETGPAPPMGFIMVLPVYEKGAQPATPEERRAAITGYVSSFFRIEELMADVFSEPVHEIDLHLYDGTELSAETLLYDSHVTPEEDHGRRPLFTSTETIDLYGHQWTFVYESRPAFEVLADRYSHWAILGAGLLISFLVFFYLKSMQQMNAAISKSEEALKASLDLLSIAGRTAKFGGWSVDLKSNIVTWSDQVAEIHDMHSGYSPLVSEGISFYAPEWREQITAVFTACAEEGIPYDEEMEIITGRGRRIWIRTVGSAVKDERGNITKVQGAFQDITERKKAEDHLQRVNFSVENMSDSIFWVGETGCFTDVNPAACQKLGYTRDELLTMCVADIDPHFPREQWAAHWEEMCQCGLKVIETIHHTKDGRIIPMELAIHHQIFGETRYNIVLGRDITERKKAEEKILELNKVLEQRVEERTASLKKSEEQLRAITDNVSDVVAVCNTEGIATYMSPQSNKLLGYQAEELVGRPIFELVFPDDLPGAMETYRDSLQAEEPGKLEYRIVTRDGSLVWVETQGDLMHDDDGRISGAVFVTRDISERKEWEKTVAASRKMYKSVVDTQQELVDRCLPDTTITFVNDALCRALGKSRDELLGQKYSLFLSPEEFHERVKILNSLSPDKPLVTAEYRVNLPDGSTVWQEWTDQALFDENGEVIEIQGVGRDITERRQAEEEAQRHAYRTEALLKVSSRFNAELELDKVRKAICEETCNALKTQMAAYLYYSTSDRCFYLASSSNLPDELPRLFVDLSRKDYDAIVGKLGKAGLITDLASMPELPYAQLLLNHNIKGFAYAVVERDGLPLGIILTGSAGEDADLPEDAVALLSGLADQAASAVTNARLLQETKDRLRQVQALRNIDLAITGSLDLRVTFQVVLDEVTGILNTDAAAILLLNPYSNTLRYEQWRGFQSKDLNGVSLPLGKGYGGRAAAERQSIQINNLSKVEPDPVQGHLLVKEGFAAYFAVPLIAKGTVKGVLEVYHREPVETNGDWLAFMETLAGQAAIAVDNAELFSKLERSSVELLQAYNATIEGWAHALDLKDEETEDHSQRVTEMTVAIARQMNIKDEELAHVRRGALLHDIGKMGIPDAILLKPGKLTDVEWVIMRKHPVYAYDMLAPIEYLRPALDIPYCHHEKWDGSGYPRGLKGKAIPLPARIFAVVDVYDALTSDRPYRKAWSREEALEHIKKESGRHFDPDVVEVFLQEINYQR